MKARLQAKLGRMARELRGAAERGALRWKYREALRHEGPAVVEDAFGFRFVLQPYERPLALQLLERAHDRVVLRAMQRLIRPGDVVLDVGAHVGEISVPAARLCGAQGKVYAFEPVEESCARFMENAALNGCENILLQRTAAGERTGTVTMNVFPAAYSAWSGRGEPVYANNGVPVAKSRRVEVPCTTLDEFCAAQGIARISFLKVDVEGYERDVFHGAERLLKERKIDSICFEISQIPLQGAGRTAREVFETLETAGYAAYRFEERGETFDGPVHDSKEFWTNYFASWKQM
jgi:FkbM family methyltransferase